MPIRLSQRAHAPVGGARVPALALVLLVPLAGALLARATSAMDAPEAAIALDPDEARRAGVALTLVAHPDLPGRPLEVLAADGAGPPGALLDIATTGASVAVVPAIGPEETILTLARADGTQLQVPLDGALAATYAPDGAWLAVVDATGRLWHLDADDGDLHRLADGPFIAAPIVEPDGAVLALAVPAVEAPFRALLVRVDGDDGWQRLSEEELVYDAARLADGSIAVVAHRPAGTIVLRLTDGRTTLHANLGPDAVNVSLSADGNVIAWETAGETFVRIGAGSGRSLGPGSRPTVAADGSAILVQRGTGMVLLDIEGHELAELASASALLNCAEGCEP